ncbi:MAG TPA: glycosyltransferase [Longimicrobiales bacterium]
MTTALILSFSDLGRDPRVHRQIRFLAGMHRVIAVGYADPQVEGVTFIRVERGRKDAIGKVIAALQLIARRYERYYWRQARVRSALEALADVRADVVIANDIDALPLAVRLARGAKVIYDAHEYAPRQFENRRLFRWFFQSYVTHLCRTYIPRADAMMTVGQEIAKRYEAETGVRPVVVTNAPDYADLEPGAVAPGGRIRLVHHGRATPSRRLEKMIRAMDLLDERFELDFLLFGGSERYREALEQQARPNPRIRFRDPVPMQDLPRFLNRYDMGIFLLEPFSFNARYALPNKLFEFIQARLAVAVGPSPEMARIVEEYGVGVVAEDFTPESFAAAIRSCTVERIGAFKRRAHEAARVLSADANRETILALVDRVLNGAGASGSATPPRPISGGRRWIAEVS